MEPKTTKTHWSTYILSAVLAVISTAATAKTDLECLAKNIYHEARGEPMLGKLAVAQVTLNRAKYLKHSICRVVYYPDQFSWTKHNLRILDFDSWLEALQLAERVLKHGRALKNFPATHYHNHTVSPNWRHNMYRVSQIHNHKFYYDPSHSYPR